MSEFKKTIDGNYPSFHFYPKDFLTDPDLELMSDLEYRAYTTLLFKSWLTKGLPLEDESLAKLSGAREKWPECREKVMKKFSKNSDKYFNTKLENVRKKMMDLSFKRSKSGKKGGDSTSSKSKTNDEQQQ